MAGYLIYNPLKDGRDVNSIMGEMMSVIFEGSLYGELDDELGYSKYNYKTRIQTTVVTVMSRKLCIQAMGIWILIFLVTVMVSINHRL